MSKELELLAEIRDLLEVMAEPLMEKRHKKFREGIRAVVGKKKNARGAVLLMDGTRTQAAIAKEAGVDTGQLNRLVKDLVKESLCVMEGKHPKLATKLPADFLIRMESLMSEYETEMLQALQKISGLLELLAEEKIAQRDAKQRATLREIVGSSKPKQKSVFLMNGMRTQKEIRAETLVNQGHLSTMAGKLHKAKLLMGDTIKPHLAISVPPNFFENDAKPE